MKTPLDTLTPLRFETAEILKKVALASRKLAELKGMATTIPDQAVLVNTLVMREAKDSSAIENIFTTHDEMFRDDASLETAASPAVKEVRRYKEALFQGFVSVKQKGIITTNDIVAIQGMLIDNNAGIRKLPGTVIKDGYGRVVYTPPQEYSDVIGQLTQLEKLINDDEFFSADPLVKLAIMHHRFESIHPFYDGNGRTGRILNVLYLVKEDLLKIPVVYMSKYIMNTKSTYYALLQAVGTRDAWEEWVLYMLDAVQVSAADAIETTRAIRLAMENTKQTIHDRHKFYSQDLVNNLFTHPYTKIAFIERDLGVSRGTATKYLEALADDGILKRHKVGRNSYYINRALYKILTGEEAGSVS